MPDAKSTERKFYSAFHWPVPESFASAVASSRFELGDVLYRKKEAYQAWSDQVPRGVMAIQVLDPPRSTRGALLEGDSDRRRANWESDVRIALIEPESGHSVERVVTQGKLLMALWQGDDSWLESDRPPPEFPKTARDLHGMLESTPDAWADVLARSRPRSGSLFVMVVDLASDASRAKAALVGERLRATGKLLCEDRTPSDADLADPETYHPTLILRGFVLAGRDKGSVESDLRACLYRGGLEGLGGVGDIGGIGSVGGTTPKPNDDSGSQTEETKTPTSDRFSIARHGLLVSF